MANCSRGGFLLLARMLRSRFPNYLSPSGTGYIFVTRPIEGMELVENRSVLLQCCCYALDWAGVGVRTTVEL